MQNKGFVKVFAVLLTLVCMFYLSFSFVTRHYNSKATEYAGGDPVKESSYLDSLSTQKVWLGYTLKECREMEISLGLDLKGGMNVVLELNVADVIRSLSNNNQDENFNKALDLAYENQAASQKDFIDLFAEEYKKLDNGARLSAIFSTFELKDKITPQSSDAQVIAVLKDELQSAIDNSFNVLRTRIDRFGVVSPNIQRLETAGRILVELPGVKEPERVRKLLQGSANLEFWETYDLPEIYQQLVAADNMLATILKSDDTAAEGSETTTVEATSEVVADNAAAETTNDADSLLAKIGEDKPEAQAAQSMEEFAKLHPLFAVLQINQYNGQLASGPVVGIADKKDMAKIDEYLNMKQVKDLLPRNLSLKWGVKAIDEKEQFFYLYAIKKTNRDGTPALGGDVVTDANADFVQQAGRSEQVVDMVMNAEGAKAWARLTKENIGKAVAIVLDDMVYSAPNVQVEITGGRSQITGHFTPEEAKDLANVLKSGKMAASVHIVQEDVVGPSLGQEAINSGVISFVLALVLLMFYMCAFYGVLPGLIADGALVLNIFFTMGILASFQAVLTLPGIAGMVLTLGMAVDANVLIYERTKEELRAGKSLSKAIADGYSNAFSAIFDSNLTSIITGVVLFYFGTGPIRGFATTMIIGLFASFLTAVFLTRIVYEALLAKDKLKNVTFTTSITKDLLTNPKINFLGARKVGYLIPVVIIVLGAISMSTIGLNNGIDFTGGRNYVIRFAQDVKTDEVRNLLDAQLDGSVSVIQIGTPDQVRVSTNYKIEDNDPAIDQEIENKLFEGVKSLLPEGTTLAQFTDQYIQSSQKVGPSMADDIKNAAFLAVVFAMFCMAAYILLRFRDISFSVGAFASVAVTTLCIISFYTLLWKVLPFSMEVDQTFIAAILTIIGYSINDTVVVFDRIRETIGLYPKRDRYQVINDALNSTLSRTFNTSLTTLVVVLCIFILGGATIRSFTFAILLGIIIGTYSTLFVATPIAYELQKKKINKKAAAEAGK
ncbi:export membrane protein SecD [Parabacteroides johnsonii DSM 18315]|jgi:protein-export membrane protein, secD/secF family|uniref:Multifunctional fusion protein n=1 Tax=Parabacteroides johnsonii DSM 18315 TaxID=537006 RepID=B7BG93_9BACT|nr:protein translocase subunit SecDF [Parabacteroides johnsonii]EEC94545.1 export membrane protein SecD [Parabacteroides johnsonii DSM 18315]UEA90678.1 protein translocase subunit SecDF [Parabacteroides johnsonii]UWP42833.1 protein translocase subunit SecDF [Parabacteroides johnsonii DSM 18315]HJG98274.1 protein translocase subunit SecDF [Parabacteroides johnsonii]